MRPLAPALPPAYRGEGEIVWVRSFKFLSHRRAPLRFQEASKNRRISSMSAVLRAWAHGGATPSWKPILFDQNRRKIFLFYFLTRCAPERPIAQRHLMRDFFRKNPTAAVSMDGLV